MNKNLIHNFDEFDSDDSRNPRNSGRFLKIFVEGRYNGDPRKETFCRMIKDTLCPNFKIKSFTFTITIINIILYTITLFPNGLNPSTSQYEFLPPSVNTLIDFGALYSKKLRENIVKNIYRWFMNGLLHANFVHILSNTFGILVLGSLAERLNGTVKFASTYIICGILGSLFSVLCKVGTISVGASISIFAIVGMHFAYALAKWKEINKMFGRNGKIYWICYLIFFTMFSVVVSPSLTEIGVINNSIDFYGHLGGLVTGFFYSMLIIQPDKDNSSLICRYKKWNYYCLYIVATFAIGGFACFYTLDFYEC